MRVGDRDGDKRRTSGDGKGVGDGGERGWGRKPPPPPPRRQEPLSPNKRNTAHLSGVALVEALLDGDLAQGLGQVALHHGPDLERDVGLAQHHLEGALKPAAVLENILGTLVGAAKGAQLPLHGDTSVGEPGNQLHERIGGEQGLEWPDGGS